MKTKKMNRENAAKEKLRQCIQWIAEGANGGYKITPLDDPDFPGMVAELGLDGFG